MSQATPTSGLTPADDDFHEMGDRWWATETVWFAFHHVQSGIGGWLYALMRPNIGTCAGGIWIWDRQTTSPFDAPYAVNYSSLRLPARRDLTHITFPVGWSLRVLEPLTRYHLRAEDGDRLSLDLTFEAIMPPEVMGAGKPPYLSGAHVDQFGRLTGEVVLHGQPLRIDCLSERDRSWGPRPESHPRRLSFDFAVADERTGFLCTTDPTHADGDVVTHGFLLRDGIVSPLAVGRREVERAPGTGMVLAEVITGTDEQGRTFTAHGTAVSRMAVNRHSAVTHTTLMTWDLDGVDAVGEDQDMWPVLDWLTARRHFQNGSTAPPGQ